MEIKRKGTVFARIYRQTRHKHTDRQFHVYQVADYSTGRRILRSYTDFDKAKAEANTIADNRSKAGNSDEASLILRGAALASYTTANELLRPSGIALHTAAHYVAEGLKILGADKFIEAIRYFAKTHPESLPQKTVREVVDELIETKRNLQRGERYLSDLNYRLGSFAKDFQRNLSTVTAGEIQEWLHKLKLKPQSYLNFRTVIGTLFRYAKRRGYLTRDNDEAERIEKVDGNGGTIEIYTPAELQRLIKASPKAFVPSLVIGAFAGLRSSEIERLEWKHVDLGRKFITVVGARKRGTPSRRVVPIADNLVAWLTPHAKKAGKVWTGTHDEFYDAQQDTAAAAEIEWKHNALRHSFISYRLAEIQNVNQVSLEAGHSANTMHAHYKELVTPEQAKEWFRVSA
jgi:integrase